MGPKKYQKNMIYFQQLDNDKASVYNTCLNLTGKLLVLFMSRYCPGKLDRRWAA